jgi:plasmid stability protein
LAQSEALTTGRIAEEALRCETVNMKNITVSVDEDLYRRARVRAAELDTSVSAVVRDFLVDFARRETDFERRRALQDQTLASIRAFRGGSRLTREQVHERDALR